MKNANRLMMLVILLLAPPTVIQAQTQQAGQETSKPPIPNYPEFSPRIGTGGQPTEDGMRLIAGKGYKIIINIRSGSEPFDIAAKEKQVLQLGLRYYMVPFVANVPSEEQALAFNALMSALSFSSVSADVRNAVRPG